MDIPGPDRQLHQEIPLKADPFVQLKLLDVQELDSRIDLLNQQLGSIPEAAQLRELGGRRRAVDDVVRDLRIALDDLNREQRRADADVEQVKTRRERDQGMIDAGQVKDPKALERMLGELESLHRRISSLEDVELEVMEKLETTRALLDERDAELTALGGQVDQLSSALDRKAVALRTELGSTTRERAQTVSGLPDDLVTLYEKLRAKHNGVGAAALRRRACEGCRLTLNASDLGIIAKLPTDEVVRCEECDRILVRTGESGLAAPA